MEIFNNIVIAFRDNSEARNVILYSHLINIYNPYNYWNSFLFNHDFDYRVINYLVGSCDGSDFYNDTNKKRSIYGVVLIQSFNLVKNKREHFV